jgi:hypothetical protein
MKSKTTIPQYYALSVYRKQETAELPKVTNGFHYLYWCPINNVVVYLTTEFCAN